MDGEASHGGKETGCGKMLQKDSSVLDGRTKTNAKAVAKKKARRSKSFTTAQAGTKSDVGSQRFEGIGSKHR